MNLAKIGYNVLTGHINGGGGTIANFVRSKKRKGWGIKYYYAPHYAEMTYSVQRRIAKYRLAPRVGKMFSFKTPHCFYGLRTWYGYWTEAADYLCCEASVINGRFCEQTNRNIWEQIKLNAEKIEKKTGITIRDKHDENWGLVRGIWMPIDFSHYSENGMFMDLF